MQKYNPELLMAFPDVARGDLSQTAENMILNAQTEEEKISLANAHRALDSIFGRMEKKLTEGVHHV
jgi:hypothetical protein